ncbi:PREDICTED: uncharacterized protein LOC109485312 [Branchiostoma belcheri]|uniref:Uncharacterized protein LOC109485312 n=1 Tax=Branchiostoma belcheri TaxID=7741 RepID=A0A6P5ADL8_BRABE|nr:PREDICTED: uncharacterized protein LOC109485312 [Branchiostoma belcheri]
MSHLLFGFPSVVCLLFWSLPLVVSGFNLDTDRAAVRSGPEGSFFGFSVAMHRTPEGRKVLLVGAPRANWTHAPDLERPGALYQCPLDEHNCSQVVVDTEGSRTGTKRMVEIKYRDNKNNMWLGATVRTHQGRVVVCGPMWKNAYFRRYTILNGICYEMDASLETDTVQKRMPCLGDQPTTVSHPLGHQINEGGDYTYGKCQAGLAAVYTQNGSQLVLGAPGGYDWTGTLSTYTGSYQTVGHPETWDPWPEGGAVKQPHDSYIGFSLAAGKFFGDGVEYIAAGAPRHQHRGAVVFFQETEGSSGALEPTNTLKGTQLASGFGYSMVALDLIKDGVTDLLVGAPVYMDKGVGGAVYLYSTRDKSPLQLMTMLTGPPASQFGLSLSSAGDLNGDGFTDIAVGAPNEGGGAVYIYHGSRNGLNNHYAQRISAEEVGLPNLSSFGWSLLGDVDVDDNRWPDLIVGSYGTDSVHILQSRPLVPYQVNASLSLDPPTPDPDVRCDLGGKNYTCLKLKLEFLYSGPGAADSYVDLDYTVEADSPRDQLGLERRLFFPNQSSTYKAQAPLRVYLKHVKSKTITVYVKDKFEDITARVPIILEFSIFRARRRSQFPPVEDSGVLPAVDDYPLLQSNTAHIYVNLTGGCMCRNVRIKKSDDCFHCPGERSTLQFIEDQSLTPPGAQQGDIVRMQPQRVALDLRPGSRVSFDLQVRRLEDYPIDLYYLLDMSKSMQEFRDELTKLGKHLARKLSEKTESFRLGLGAFVEKPVDPFAFTAFYFDKKKGQMVYKLEEPCAGCVGPYIFKNVLPLTNQTDRLGEVVRFQKNSSNADLPEGVLDGMLQATVCQGPIGWRKQATRLLLVATDAGFHYAGDGKLAGLVTPNDGRCHVGSDGNFIKDAVNQDFPSVAQLKGLLEEHNTMSIFAVTQRSLHIYEELSQLLEGSTAKLLANDSSNLLDLVSDAYEELTSRIRLLTKNVPQGVDLSITAKCPHQPNGTASSECHPVLLGETVTFTITAEVDPSKCLSAPEVSTVTIQPVGYNEYLTIDLHISCTTCLCQSPEKPCSCEATSAHSGESAILAWLSEYYWVAAVLGAMLLVTAVLVFTLLGMRCRDKQPRMDEAMALANEIEMNGHVTTTYSRQQQGGLEGTQANEYVPEGAFATASPSTPLELEETIPLFLQDILIDRERVFLEAVIGKGFFGLVFKGKLKSGEGKDEMDVAVKTLKHASNSDELEAFLGEGIMMKDFNHPNVLTLIGVCMAADEPPLVILPFMAHGDLATFLRDPDKTLTRRDLLTFGRDIARGMAYLSDLKFVHRDLAARNCMLDDTLTVKVADFGLSRDIYEREYYSSGDKRAKLPVKWMAIESLTDGIYSTKTDVWSYGVVLWEIWTRGVIPYPDVDNMDVTEYLLQGRRLRKPRHCQEALYQTMLRCWSSEPEDRPTFSELVAEMEAILSRTSSDLTPDDHVLMQQPAVYVNIPNGRTNSLW